MMRSLRVARFQSEYKESPHNSFFPKTLDKLIDDWSEETRASEGGDTNEKKDEKDGEKDKTDELKEGEVTEQEEGNGKLEGGDGELEEQTQKEDGAKDDGKYDECKDDESKEEKEGKEESETKRQDMDNDTGGACKPPSHIVDTKSSKDKNDEKKNSSTVVFSYHHMDVKFAYFLRELILTYAPSVVVKSEFSSDQERLESLEAADHIVAFLSPNYIESPQHVEEFHMGLWRQRVSPDHAPLLLSVEVAPLPRRPTYFQLVGCPVNTWDVLWADLLGVQKVAPAKEVEEVRHRVGFKKLPKLSPDETLPMTEVAQMLVSYIKTSR